MLVMNGKKPPYQAIVCDSDEFPAATARDAAAAARAEALVFRSIKYTSDFDIATIQLEFS
jgi:hypothetical protein